MVYVIDPTSKNLDASSIAGLSDLGLAGQTWSLSSLSFSDGKLYARTLKELICFEK